MKKFAMMVFSMLLLQSTAFAADMYGVFMVVKGDVQVQNLQNAKVPAKVGSKINVGEMVITGPDSRAKIVMSDRNVMNIMPDTKMKIEKYTNDAASGQKNVELSLVEGKVRNNVEQTYDGEKSKFMVKTPTAVAGVRGTQFVTSFDVKSQSTQIVTLKGAVHVNAMANGKPVGAPVIVTKGQMTTAGAGKPAGAPVTVPKDMLKNIDAGSVAKMSSPAPAGGGSNTASNGSSSSGGDASRQPASAGNAPAPAPAAVAAPSMTSAPDIDPTVAAPPVPLPPKAPAAVAAPVTPVFRPTGNTQLTIRPK